jgi:DNA modification methylase
MVAAARLDIEREQARLRQAGLRLNTRLIWSKRAEAAPASESQIMPCMREVLPTIGPLLRLIRAFSQQGDVVFDPFCGGGGAPLAAKLSGRSYIGIELRQDYCEVA